jgi:hypothetical protein
MKIFRVFVFSIVASIFAPSAQAADFFQSLAEYRDGILYLPRVNVDFISHYRKITI